MCSCTEGKSRHLLFPLAALPFGFDRKGPRATQMPTKIAGFFSAGQHAAHLWGGKTRLIFKYFLEALLTIHWIAIL